MDNAVRLLLQHFVDSETNGGYPSVLADAVQPAVSAGFLLEEYPDGGGWVTHSVTPEGKTALDVANQELGHHATRYVYRTRFFPSAGEVLYDAPFLVPLSTPTRRVMGALCV